MLGPELIAAKDAIRRVQGLGHGQPLQLVQAGPKQPQATRREASHDPPDQFVLAQLRGSSYYTVARNVRPAGATDGYAGPLWNVVRIDEGNDQEERLLRGGL